MVRISRRKIWPRKRSDRQVRKKVPDRPPRRWRRGSRRSATRRAAKTTRDDAAQRATESGETEGPVTSKVYWVVLPLHCGSGGIGRRASLRSWFPQGSEGSSPFFRTSLRFASMKRLFESSHFGLSVLVCRSNHLACERARPSHSQGRAGEPNQLPVVTLADGECPHASIRVSQRMSPHRNMRSGGAGRALGHGSQVRPAKRPRSRPSCRLSHSIS